MEELTSTKKEMILELTAEDKAMILWAIANGCLDEEAHPVAECDQCEQKTVAVIAKVFSDQLVICGDCKGGVCHDKN